MLGIKIRHVSIAACMLLTGCVASGKIANQAVAKTADNNLNYFGTKCVFPKKIAARGKRLFVFDPNNFAWGAYSKNGVRVGYGRASGGARWNKSLNRPSITPAGTFKIRRKGDVNCISHRYPRPHGGALMPYCMFFLTNYAIHGAPAELVPNHKNITHGCIRVTLSAAKWLHEHFLKIGSLVKVLPYLKKQN